MLCLYYIIFYCVYIIHICVIFNFYRSTNHRNACLFHIICMINEFYPRFLVKLNYLMNFLKYQAFIDKSFQCSMMKYIFLLLGLGKVGVFLFLVRRPPCGFGPINCHSSLSVSLSVSLRPPDFLWNHAFDFSNFLLGKKVTFWTCS